MKHRILTAVLLALPAAVAVAQPPTSLPQTNESRPDEDRRLPNGKRQSEEILREEHQKSLDDATRLAQLSEEVRSELEKNGQNVLPLGTLKKLDEIDKLTRRIRTRLKH